MPRPHRLLLIRRRTSPAAAVGPGALDALNATLAAALAAAATRALAARSAATRSTAARAPPPSLPPGTFHIVPMAQDRPLLRRADPRCAGQTLAVQGTPRAPRSTRTRRSTRARRSDR